MTSGENVERVTAALGPAWATFQAAIDRWMAQNGDTLRDRWDGLLDDQELLNHELGAFLHDPAAGPVDFDYDATPEDSYAFASTGVDGEHYSVLLGEDRNGLIVVTAPMAFDRPNVVVGESLVEALALVSGGCGFSGPPNLAYQSWDEAIATIERPTDNALWQEISRELALVPWSEPAARLARLQDDHLGSVRPRRN